MNIALNTYTKDPQYMADFLFISELSNSDFEKLILYSTSAFQKYLQANVFSTVYT